MSAFVAVRFDDLFLKLNNGSFLDEEEEEEDRTAAVVETDFDFLEFVRR